MASDIVQEWTPDHAANGDRQLNDARPLIRRTFVESGIERPRDYSVSFHYNPAVEQHHFGRSHPMKPWRLQLTKQLILSYGLHYAMDLYHTKEASKEELAEYHKEEYLDFLSQVTPDNMAYLESAMRRFNFGDDCPVFDGLFRYCSLYTGATMSAALSLTASPQGQSSVGSSSILPSPSPSNSSAGGTALPASNIAINWSGGLHHAKKSEASGFCYVNDIVLAIQHLLQTYSRVLYIDIDVHHGDGVEQAFHSSDRVLTLSFHKYDPETFFPGTGGIKDIGPENPRNPGRHFSLNVPLGDGIDDDQYITLFRHCVQACVDKFRPAAIVLQCGADSLGGDRLGKFNLNIEAHGACVSYVKSFRLPLLVLGGGGYTARNVARAWCHETALIIGCQDKLSASLPAFVPYRQAFEGPERGSGLLLPNLSHIEGRRHKNGHDDQYIDLLIRKIHEECRYIEGSPSVEMHQLPRNYADIRREIDRRIADQGMDAVRGELMEQYDEQRRAAERNIGGHGEDPFS